MSSKSISPNHREGLTARSSVTGLDEYILSTNGAININGTIGGSPLPIAGATTGVGVAILDGSGNQITSFGGGTQYTNGAAQASPTGTVALGYDGANVRALKTDTSGNQLITGTGSAGTAASGVVTIQGISSMTPIQVSQATAANLNATVVGTGTFAVQAAGSTAAGSSLTANPITVGGLGKTANPTAVSDGQVVNALFDKLGKQVTVGSVRDLKVNQITTITASASETTVLTQVASTFLDVYGCIVTNTSATAVTVAFKDSTSGTTQFNIAVPAGDIRGFMLPEGGAVKQTTVNNNWTATTQSVTSVIITMLAVKNT